LDFSKYFDKVRWNFNKLEEDGDKPQTSVATKSSASTSLTNDVTDCAAAAWGIQRRRMHAEGGRAADAGQQDGQGVVPVC
jgi:hypothetical protein